MSNPYATPRESDRPRRSLVSVGAMIATVIACTFTGGLIGAGIGFTLGKWVPNYYRSVFRAGNDPNFNPLSIGIGLGLTQGAVVGLLAGIPSCLRWLGGEDDGKESPPLHEATSCGVV